MNTANTSQRIRLAEVTVNSRGEIATVIEPVRVKQVSARTLAKRRRKAIVQWLAVMLLLAGVIAVGLLTQKSNMQVLETTQHTVAAGEALEVIARQYRPNEDPRMVVREIEQVNGLTGATIHPGQSLEIPLKVFYK